MRFLQDMDVTNKRVIVRVDYNVPVKNGKILDDNKIRKSLETINYLIDKNCKIILLSHFGKVKKEEDKRKNSLKIVAERLNELVNTNVIFSPATRSSSLEMKAMDLQPKEILMLENTRFEDVPNGFESGNDPQLAAYFASLADVFVMDAFASAHRVHASTVGITKFIPSCAGFLVQKEIEMLQKYVLNPEHPFTIVMGGAKVEDKLPIIEKLLPKCDYLLLTGGLAISALKSLGLNIGESLCTTSNELLSKVKDILVKYIGVRTLLKPYIKAAMEEAHLIGTPVIKPLFFDYPEDKTAWEDTEEYLFGHDILVAPVMYKGVRERKVYLPLGESWADSLSGKVYSGGQYVTVRAELDRIPVFFKNGRCKELIGKL